MSDEYEIPHPGFFIQEEIDARGWMQRDLAFILKMEEPALNKIVKGKTGISLEMSKALGAAFGIDEDFFANLQKTYDLAHTPAPDPAIARRASLQSAYPVREMIKRGWLGDAEVSVLEDQLSHFVAPRYAAKKTNVGEDATPSQLAWLYRVVQIASSMPCKVYSEQALSKGKDKLKALMQRPEGAQQVSQLLADYGVRFVVVEGLPGGKIDGVCVWLNSDTPVIGISVRFDRIDNFWFVLWHEIAHLLKRHNQDGGAIIDVELEKERSPASDEIMKQERDADGFAAGQMVNDHEMTSFVTRRQFFAERDIVAFAHRMRVHPGIVVGQIQKRTGRWELLRKYQVKVREYVMSTAMVDGWGHVARVSV